MADEVMFTEDGKEILKTIPFTGIRRMAAQNIYESLTSMAQTSSYTKVNMEPLLNLKKKFADHGYKISVTCFIMKLVTYALQASPILNSSLVGKKIVVYKTINFATAISTATGQLVNPVIKDCEKKSVIEISNTLNELIEKANNNGLVAEDFMGGTYAISSIGKNEMCAGTPVVIAPMVAILMIGNAKPSPWVDENGDLCVKPVAYFSHSIDHRVAAGRDTSAFYTKLGEVFREPEKFIQLPE